MKIIKAPVRTFQLIRKRNQLVLKRQMLRLKKALAQEKAETKEMLIIYRKYTMRQATKEEMKVANHQFFDVIKGVGIGIFAILPFAPLTIPLMIKVGKWVGVDILPSSFNEIAEDVETALHESMNDDIAESENDKPHHKAEATSVSSTNKTPASTSAAAEHTYEQTTDHVIPLKKHEQ